MPLPLDSFASRGGQSLLFSHHAALQMPWPGSRPCYHVRELVELFLGQDFPNAVLTSLCASIICMLRLNMVRSSSAFDILHHEGDLTLH